MIEEKIVWRSQTTPDGRELVTFGTPDWPIECYGPWNYSADDVYTTILPWHWHDEMEINIVMDGYVDMMVGGKVWTMGTGQGLFINSGVMHRTQESKGWKGRAYYYSFVFHPWIVGGEPGSVFWQKYLTPLMKAAECAAIPLMGETQWEKDALAAAQRIIEVWPDKKPGYEFIVRESLSRVVFLLGQNCLNGTPPPTEKALRDAERAKTMLLYIRGHFSEKLTTEQIARSASISVSECLRCFHSVLNLTPKAYLRQYRVQQAAQQLLETEKPIADIGADCGFEDMSYFARIFREEQGVSPSQYRETGKQERPLLP